MFLGQDPPPPSISIADFELWAKEHNENAAAGDWVVEDGDHARMSLRISWQDALGVVRGERNLEDAQRERLASLLRISGALVGQTVAAWMLEWTPSTFRKYRTRTGFPRPVVRLGGGPAWLRSDIEDYANGRRDFGTEEFTLQHEFLENKELPKRLGMPEEQIRSEVYEEWRDIAPPPSSKAARRLYWSRLSVERWDARACGQSNRQALVQAFPGRSAPAIGLFLSLGEGNACKSYTSGKRSVPRGGWAWLR